MWSEQLDRGPLTYLLRVMLGSLFLKKGNNLTIVWLQTKVSPLSLKVEERANESLLGWGGQQNQEQTQASQSLGSARCSGPGCFFSLRCHKDSRDTPTSLVLGKPAVNRVKGETFIQ